MIEQFFSFSLQYLQKFIFLLMQVYSYFWICEHLQNKEWKNRTIYAFNRSCNRTNGESVYSKPKDRWRHLYFTRWCSLLHSHAHSCQGYLNFINLKWWFCNRALFFLEAVKEPSPMCLDSLSLIELKDVQASRVLGETERPWSLVWSLFRMEYFWDSLQHQDWSFQLWKLRSNSEESRHGSLTERRSPF